VTLWGRTDTLAAVVDPVAVRQPSASTLFETVPDSVALTATQGNTAATDEAFEAAAETVNLDVTNDGLVRNDIEPLAALASWAAADEKLTVRMTSQGPHRHPGESMAAPAARELEVSVSWTATCSANYLAGAHARDQRTTAELALDRDGTFRGLRVETDANAIDHGSRGRSAEDRGPDDSNGAAALTVTVGTSVDGFDAEADETGIVGDGRETVFEAGDAMEGPVPGSAVRSLNGPSKLAGGRLASAKAPTAGRDSRFATGSSSISRTETRGKRRPALCVNRGSGPTPPPGRERG